MFGLSDGEKNHDASCLRFDTIPECDGQTDGQTDGHLCSGYTSACIARYANTLVKSTLLKADYKIKRNQYLTTI